MLKNIQIQFQLKYNRFIGKSADPSYEERSLMIMNFFFFLIHQPAF